jgi:hypothetical protein
MQSVKQTSEILDFIHRNTNYPSSEIKTMRYSIVINLTTTLFVSSVSGLAFLRRQVNIPHCSITAGNYCTAEDFPYCVDDNYYAECEPFDNGMEWAVAYCDGGCVAMTGTSINCSLD